MSIFAACKDDPEPVTELQGRMTALIDGMQEFEASGDVNGQPLLFSISREPLLIITATDRSTINVLSIQLGNFDGAGIYPLNDENIVSYVVFDEDQSNIVFSGISGALMVDSFRWNVAMGSFEFEVVADGDTVTFTDGSFALPIASP